MIHQRGKLKAELGMGPARTALLLLFFGACGGPVHRVTAGEALSLDEATRLALENSPRLLMAEDAARAARADQEGATRGRFPSLEGEIGWSRSDHPVNVFGSLLAQERFSAQNFGHFDPATGTFDLTTLNTPDPVSNFRAALTVYQPIWTGGRLSSGIHAAEDEALAARSTAERTTQNIRFETEKAFRSALLAEKQVEVLRGSLVVAGRQAARVESLWATGLALQSDRRALQAHVSEMSAELAGVLADSAEARSALGLLLGAGGPVTATLLEPPEETGFSAPSDSEAAALALHRADVSAAEQASRAAVSMQGLLRAALLPSVGLMGVAEHNSEAFFGEGGDQWLLAVTARWRFDLGSPDRVHAAGARAEAARTSYDLTRDQALHEVRTAFDRLRAAQERKRALDAAVHFSEESYRLVEQRYHEGLATALELSEYQNTLVRTRLGAAAAGQDLALARSALLLAAGTLGPEATP